jgi:secondary thiamine-phosphate synthase enzyme
MLYKFPLKTERESVHDITLSARESVRRSGVRDGLCLVYCPHTTAGITVNENADPDVMRDVIFWLSRVYPDRPEFRHIEGNSAAHLKATAVGSGATVIVEGGELALGQWQSVYFCEFDGPRDREYCVKVVSD